MAEEMQETDWLQEGMTVEMRSDQEGYQGAWFTVKIIKLRYKKNRVYRIVVEHLDFTESCEPNSKKLQETVKKDHLRPLPLKLPHKQWKERDAVETLHEGVWWIGYIKRYNAKKDKYLVFYGREHMDLEIAASDIRSRQDYVRTCSWNISPAMQKPADWVKNKETQVVKTQSKAKGSSTHYKQCESDDSQDEDDSRDEDWDKDEYKRKKKPRLGIKTSRQA